MQASGLRITDDSENLGFAELIVFNRRFQAPRAESVSSEIGRFEGSGCMGAVEGRRYPK